MEKMKRYVFGSITIGSLGLISPACKSTDSSGASAARSLWEATRVSTAIRFNFEQNGKITLKNLYVKNIEAAAGYPSTFNAPELEVDGQFYTFWMPAKSEPLPDEILNSACRQTDPYWPFSTYKTGAAVAGRPQIKLHKGNAENGLILNFEDGEQSYYREVTSFSCTRQKMGLSEDLIFDKITLKFNAEAGKYGTVDQDKKLSVEKLIEPKDGPTTFVSPRLIEYDWKNKGKQVYHGFMKDNEGNWKELLNSFCKSYDEKWPYFDAVKLGPKNDEELLVKYHSMYDKKTPLYTYDRINADGRQAIKSFSCGKVKRTDI